MRTKTNALISLMFFLAMFCISCFADSTSDQFQSMIKQLQQNPSDNALREKIIKQAQSMQAQPNVPDEAIRREGRGKFAFKNAKSASDYVDAAKEYEQAIASAPWVTGYYSDLCTIYEKAGKLAEAKSACQIYLAVITDPKEASATKERIAGLEYGLEKNSPQEVAKQQASQFPKNLEGAIWVQEQISLNDVGDSFRQSFMIKNGLLVEKRAYWGPNSTNRQEPDPATLKDSASVDIPSRSFTANSEEIDAGCGLVTITIEDFVITMRSNCPYGLAENIYHRLR